MEHLSLSLQLPLLSRSPKITVTTTFDIVSLDLIYLTVVGNGSHRFRQFRNKGATPIPKQYSIGRALFSQDEIISNLVLLVLLMDEISSDEFLIGCCHSSGRPIMDESEVNFFRYHQLLPCPWVI